MFCVLLVGFAFGQTATPPLAGDGTVGNPYQIASLENLYWLQVNNFPGYSIQTADIDASPTSTWNPNGTGGYYGWEPLGVDAGSPQFSGSYNGQGYSIDGLYINRPSSQYVGFIGMSSGGTVNNLYLKNADISGSNYVGGIVGMGSINLENCSLSGSISGSSVGGLAGKLNNNGGQTIQNCYCTATVSGSPAGGIVGDYYGSSITNCYSKGTIIAGINGGGLIGLLSNSFVLYCYSATTVNVGGGLIGAAGSGGEEGGANTILYSFWDTEVSGQTTSSGGIGYTTAQMKSQEEYIGWDFTSIWTIDSGINSGYPYLQSVPTEDALPITLDKFTAVYKKGNVQITWRTESETDNAKFLIYRDGEVIAAVDGAGTSSEPHDYSYTDIDVLPGKSYTYVLADVSLSNELVVHHDHALTITIDEQVISEEFALGSNYPNPFNPSTTIPFNVLKESHITLGIYDINGQLVRQLINENYASGAYTAIWDGQNDEGKDLHSGLYIYLMTSNNSTQSGKMLLVK
jgi:hypothetical protein